ncbi:NAD dependent epimerase/dehydratase family protein [Leptospira yanagawae serovar Saopaulo str. Sao Paulo = ATCC 700523]|uniref:NAD dependent epimerase/dehydratase family protein n=1 Tax=Leptospira yanagawae serovar Saopaulo str. Sao Paulo = ATCC 700523 TaxID=1249483 RepID=A0A5E8HBJ5_9LEPT|nr:NAD-dependent epimerase/dehydratase family protein [Leptospira yanagawae]EOQ88222.1 NAD dependent epimerase/dehydratase family protein [Leptospira yanagawae serovar Saopaulo str. Sao Paulo = ATCC 700523]
MKTLLITGGAGFLGSNLAIEWRKKYPHDRIFALDNLKRRGGELNLPRLKSNSIEFIHGDIRIKEDLLSLPKIDLILECSAEPSVLAGVNESPEYLIQTNLVGTINCLELARRDNSDFVFFSTSRIYPIEYINALKFEESSTRFEWLDDQIYASASSKGISEYFPLDKIRSLYGTTKLASELIIQEYADLYKFRSVINRCGVLTGPWQMGKVDQGIFVYWLASHIFKRPLKYFGYGGKGKQVRDFLHFKDLFDLLVLQTENWEKSNAQVFNVGGGREVSLSLCELTEICQKLTGNQVSIESIPEDRAMDIRIYLTDTSKAKKIFDWSPQYKPKETIAEIYKWIIENQSTLVHIL